MLSNDNIHLRALELDDIDKLYAWENNSHEWHAGNTLAPYSRHELRQHVLRGCRSIYDQKQLRLMIEQKNPVRPAGIIDLYEFDPHHRRAAVGILIEAERRCKGIATQAVTILTEYAFNVLRLHQVYAYIQSDNEISRKLFTRCGFIHSGTLAGWVARKEGFADACIFQLINHS
jgi:diamine N-acetyltransferase